MASEDTTNTGNDSSPTTTSEYGIEANFIELPERLTCPICLTALKNPVQTACGHRFCQLCLHKSTVNARYSKCPIDKTLIDIAKQVFHDNAVKREVLSLEVKCNSYEDGCSWTGELRDLQTHSDVCPDLLLSCTNEGCNKKIKRSDLPTHIEVCELRLMPCCHCSTDCPVTNLPKHQLLSCSKFPVSCPVCGEPNILREDIQCHLAEACPLVDVTCDFQEIGCRYQGKRENLKSHQEAASHEHMLYARDQINELSSKLRHLKLKSEAEKIVLKDKVDQLSLRVHTLETTSYNGELLWKLNVRSDRSHEGPSFYTGRPGYKLKVIAKLKHRSSNHLSLTLFFCLKKGEMDEYLPSSYEGACVVTVIDPSGKMDHLVEEFIQFKFLRCNDMDIHRCRTVNYLEFDAMIPARKYIKDDTLFMQIKMKHVATSV